MKSLMILMLGLICSVVHANDKDHVIERFTEKAIIKAPTKAKISNPYGDIRIRKADDEEFIYHGVAQSNEEGNFKLKFSYEDSLMVAKIEHSKPELINPRDRYDLAIVVPESVDLDIEIEQGRLSSKGLDSAIKVRTKSSDVDLKTSQAVDLFSETGNISLTLTGNQQKSSSKIQSYQGSVTVKYNEVMPLFKIKTGNYVSSNSVKLLQSKSQQQRTQLLGKKNANRDMQIITDSGAINLIDLSL